MYELAGCELDAVVALESHIDRFTICRFSLDKRELFSVEKEKKITFFYHRLAFAQAFMSLNLIGFCCGFFFA